MEFGPSWCIGSTFPRAIPHPSVNLYYSCEAQGLRGDLEVLCYQALEDVWEVRSWRSTPHSGQRDLQWAILEICRMGRGCLLILVFVWPGLFPTWVGLLLCPRHLSLSTHTCPRCFYSLLEIYLPIYIFCVIYKKQVLFKNLKTILKYVCMRECHTAWGQMSGQCVCECAHSMGADVRGLCVYMSVPHSMGADVRGLCVCVSMLHSTVVDVRGQPLLQFGSWDKGLYSVNHLAGPTKHFKMII